MKYLVFLSLFIFNSSICLGVREIDTWKNKIFINDDKDNNNVKVEVFDPVKGKTVYSIVLRGIYSSHSNVVEYHNHNLYVIHRTGGSDGYEKHPDTWTDELWRYDASGKGEKLFSTRGLDFRVSPDEKTIVVTDGSSLNPGNGHLIILDSHGKISKIFDVEKLGFEDVNMYLTNDTLFLSDGGVAACFDSLVQINLKDFSRSVEDLGDIEFCDEWDFNPSTKRVAGSDHPVFYDADGYADWKKQGRAVTLYVYDIPSRKQLYSVTSQAKPFRPKWKSDNRLEINDPTTNKRITIELKN